MALADSGTMVSAKLIYRERDATKKIPYISPFHAELNNLWVNPVFAQGEGRLELSNKTLSLPELKEREIENEFNPSSRNEAEVGGMVDADDIRDYAMKVDEKVPGSVDDLASFVPEPVMEHWTVGIPEDEWVSMGIVHSITFNSVVCTPEIREANYIGKLMVWNMEENKQYSESLILSLRTGNLTVNQTSKDQVFFKVLKDEDKMGLVLVLYMDDGMNETPCFVSYTPLSDPDPDSFFIKGTRVIGSLDETIQRATKEVDFMIAESTRISFGHMLPDDYVWTYTWMENPMLRLLALPLDLPHYWSIPTITISSIRMMFTDVPKGCRIYFTASVFPKEVSNFANLTEEGMNVFFGLSVNRYREYTSQIVAGDTDIEFNENIRIHVSAAWTPDTHVVLQARVINEKNEISIFKVAVIPFYQCFDTKRQRYEWHDPKKPRKGYIEQQKIPQKEWLECDVEVPPTYFPPSSFWPVINGNADGTTNSPVNPTELQIAGQVLPYFTEILTCLEIDRFVSWVNNMMCLDKEFIAVISMWAFSSMTTAGVFSTCLIPSLMDIIVAVADKVDGLGLPPLPSLDGLSKSKAKKLALQHQERKKLEQENDMTWRSLVHVFPALCDIILAAASQTENLDNAAILGFVEKISIFITKMMYLDTWEKVVPVTEGLAKLLFMLCSRFSFNNEISKALTGFIRVIKGSNKDNNPAHVSRCLIVIFTFMRPWTSSHNLLIGISAALPTFWTRASYSLYNPLLSQLFLAISEGLRALDVTARTLTVEFVASFFRQIHTMPERVFPHISLVLLPLVPVIAEYYISEAFGRRAGDRELLVPTIVSILNHVDLLYIMMLFQSLAHGGRTQFVALLATMLETVSKNNAKDGGVYFNVVATVVLRIVTYLRDEFEGVVPQVVNMLRVLWNDYLSLENTEIMYLFYVKMLRSYKVEGVVMNTMLSKVVSNLNPVRSMSTALLCLYLYHDFLRDSDLSVTLSYLTDGIMEVLLALTDETAVKITTIESVLESLVDCSDVFESTEFSGAISGMIKATAVISNVVKEEKTSHLPPDVRLQRMMTIADQYKFYPTMRLKWIRECIKMNEQNGDKIGAFVSQMHAIALVATIYAYKQRLDMGSTGEKKATAETRVPYHMAICRPIQSSYRNVFPRPQEYIDFSFMPELACETLIDFPKMQRLIPSDVETQFSFQCLVNEIRKGIQLGLSCGAPYSVRPLLSMQLRLHYSNNNLAAASETCTEIKNVVDGIRIGGNGQVQYSYDFFMLEVRDIRGGVLRQCACVPKGQTAMQFFDSFARGRWSDLDVHECTDHDGHCTGIGVCVVPLEISDRDAIDGEHRHCWSKFKAKIFLDEIISSELVRVEVETKQHLPHYRIVSDVVKAKFEKYPVINRVREEVAIACKSLKQLSNEIALWYEDDNCDKTHSNNILAEEYGKYLRVMDSVLKGSTCAVMLCRNMNTVLPKETKVISCELYRDLCGAMECLRRCVFEETGRTKFSKRVASYEQVVNDFAACFGQKISREVYRSSV